MRAELIFKKMVEKGKSNPDVQQWLKVRTTTTTKTMEPIWGIERRNGRKNKNEMRKSRGNLTL